MPLVFLYKLLYSTDFIAVEATTVYKPDRIEPELSFIVNPLNVDVRRLVTVAGIEEKPVSINSQCSRHYPLLLNEWTA